MEGKRFLITGASSGIGKACAEYLHQLGAEVILVARGKEKLDHIREQLGERVFTFVYDLNNLNDISKIFEFCKEKNLKLDGLVHSAGVNADCPVKVNQVPLMEEAMRVNCFSFAELGKYFYSKKYSNDGSSIVAISSIASLLCDMGMAPYSASKAALNAYVKTMSKEFVRRRIRVNAILPAGVATPMAAEKGVLMSTVKNSNVEQKKEGNIQLLGEITPENIAMQVEYLLSDKAQYITGELMVIGAGRSY